MDDLFPSLKQIEAQLCHKVGLAARVRDCSFDQTVSRMLCLPDFMGSWPFPHLLQEASAPSAHTTQRPAV